MKQLTRDEYHELGKKQYEQSRDDKTRPIYHLTAPSMWMFDINGAVYSGGKYHMFYLHNPFDAKGHSDCTLPDGTIIPGKKKANRLWAHATSDDLISWKHMKPELVLDRNDGKLKAISGGALAIDENTSAIMYTERPISGLDALKGEKSTLVSGVATPTNAFCIEGVLDAAFTLKLLGKNGVQFSMNFDGERKTRVKENAEYGNNQTLPVRAGTSWSLYVDKKVWELYMYDGITCMTGAIEDVEDDYTIEFIGSATAEISAMNAIDITFA